MRRLCSRSLILLPKDVHKLDVPIDTEVYLLDEGAQPE